MNPHVFLVAGEESGDRLGAALDRGDPCNAPRKAHFSGVGGAHMAAEGVPSLFPLGDLAIVGFCRDPGDAFKNPAAHTVKLPMRSSPQSLMF